LRIVIANEGFASFAGTETYMLSVAEQLQRTGHDTTIYGVHLGPMAELARERGVRVVGPGELPAACDLVLAQDAPSCLELWRHYPASVRIFVAHSGVFMLQSPPQVEGAFQALVVLNDRMVRWARGLAWSGRVERLCQPIDLDRFRVVRARASEPPRALLLSNYALGTRGAQVEEACRMAGVTFSRLGGQGNQRRDPELAIAGADIVLGLGRSALDGAAASRAVLTVGPLGGDGWLTRDSYAALEADGFTGRATDRVLDTDELARELAAWDPAMGSVCRDLAARRHDVRDHAAALVALAGELTPSPPPGNGVEEEMARLVRVEMQRTIALVAARKDNNRLVQEAEDALARAAAAEARLHETVASRRWRLALAATRPLDAVRRRLRPAD
jgi:hypothetical protein